MESPSSFDISFSAHDSGRPTREASGAGRHVEINDGDTARWARASSAYTQQQEQERRLHSYNQSSAQFYYQQPERTSPYLAVEELEDVSGLENKSRGSAQNPRERGVRSYTRIETDKAEGVNHTGLDYLPEEMSSRAVVHALRTLQHKVTRLEGEKLNAKERIAILEEDLSHTRRLLLHEQHFRSRSTINNMSMSQASSTISVTKPAASSVPPVPIPTPYPSRPAAKNTATSKSEASSPERAPSHDADPAILRASPPSRRSPSPRHTQAPPTVPISPAFVDVSVQAALPASSPPWPLQTQKDQYKQLVPEPTSTSPSSPTSLPSPVNSSRRLFLPTKTPAPTASASVYGAASGGGLAGLSTAANRESFAAQLAADLEASLREKIEYEMQASTYRSRASILERQLGRVRNMQEATEQERDAAKAELAQLRELMARDRKNGENTARLGQSGERSTSRSASPRARVERSSGSNTGKMGHAMEVTSAAAVVDADAASTAGGITVDSLNDSISAKASDIQVLQEEIGALRKIRRRGLEKYSSGEMKSKQRLGKIQYEGRDKIMPNEHPEWKKMGVVKPIPSKQSQRAVSADRRTSRPTTPSDSTHRFKLSSMSDESGGISNGISRTSSAAALPDGNFAIGMPFVVGANVKKSHSVTANLQRVFSLLKGHNPALCSVCVGRRSGQHLSSKSSKSRIQNRIRATPELSSIPAEADHAKHHGEIAEEGSSAAGMAKLKNVLSFLDDEFNECKKTYQSLVREYEALADRAGGRDAFVSPTEMQEASQKLKVLSNELVDVIQNMELKGDQIAILREIITSSSKHNQAHHKDQPPLESSAPSVTEEQLKAGNAKPGKAKNPSSVKPRSKTPNPRGRPTTRPSTNSYIGASQSSKKPIQRASVPHLPMRSASFSPSRALASLTLLKTSQKVQEALMYH